MAEVANAAATWLRREESQNAAEMERLVQVLIELNSDEPVVSKHPATIHEVRRLVHARLAEIALWLDGGGITGERAAAFDELLWAARRYVRAVAEEQVPLTSGDEPNLEQGRAERRRRAYDGLCERVAWFEPKSGVGTDNTEQTSTE